MSDPAPSATNQVPSASEPSSMRVLDPLERVSEVLFGLIMVLTVTASISVATQDHASIGTMLVGALGCNFAWGIIDGGMYLLARLHETGNEILMVRTVRDTTTLDAAYRIIAGALPPVLASSLMPEQVERMRQNLRQIREPYARPRLTKRDAVGAVAVFLLVFLSTFPVVLPFIFVGDARTALRASHAIAVTMLFLCGYSFGSCAGLRPWATGFVMIVIGGALVGVAFALGG
jgi:VIT1/CCC1 family predicted Fe2+/Mn2+ transporter